MTKLTGRIESAEIPVQIPKSVILQTQELTRRFDKFTAVDALNISVASGEVFGLLLIGLTYICGRLYPRVAM